MCTPRSPGRDLVLVTAKHHRLGLLNGTRTVITTVDAYTSPGMSMRTDD
jgi:hypothetical protein